MQLENLVQTLTLILTVLQCICSVCSKEEKYTFMVQPGGETHTFTGKLDDVTCSFTYASQGGTNEEWEMKIDKQSDYTCNVIRPEKESYLFFLNFELRIEGAKLMDAVVFQNRDMKEVSSSEYVKDFSASAVRHSSSFGGKMNGVVAMATKQKEDL